MNEGAILQLSEAASFARHEENLQATRVAGEFVTAEGGPEIWVCLKAGGEDDSIFDSEASALAEVRADGMGSVTQDRNPTDNPGKSREPILNACADRAFGVFDEFGNRGVPAGEEP
jgi:hypothetical protein